MKKGIFISGLLLLLFPMIITAEEIKIDNINYLKQDSFTCNNQTMELDRYIEKTGKIVVRDNDSNNYIWNFDNTCTSLTSQDRLDEYNYKTVVKSISTDEEYHVTVKTSDFSYYVALIPATGEFNPNETYYVPKHHGADKITNPLIEDFSTYYVQVYLRHPEEAKVDDNQTYYTIPYYGNSSSQVVDINTITSQNIDNYLIKTTIEEINLEEKNYTMNLATYTSINDNSYVTEPLIINDKLVIKAFGFGDDIYYYDTNGNEITKYRDYNVVQNDNYTFLSETNSRNVILYDHDEKNILYQKEYDVGDAYSSYLMYDSAFIIYEYINGSLVNHYFNKYYVLSGDNQTFTKDDITIKFNGNYYAFNKLLINDEVVESDNYILSKGSSVITLKKEYLNTLENGSYILTGVYNDGGSVKVNLNVNKTLSVLDIENPNTFDNSLIYILTVIISFFGIAILCKKYD